MRARPTIEQQTELARPTINRRFSDAVRCHGQWQVPVEPGSRRQILNRRPFSVDSDKFEKRMRVSNKSFGRAQKHATVDPLTTTNRSIIAQINPFKAKFMIDQAPAADL